MSVNLSTTNSRKEFLNQLRAYIKNADDRAFNVNGAQVELKPQLVHATDGKYMDISIFRDGTRIIGVQVYCLKDRRHDTYSFRVSLQMKSEPETPFLTHLCNSPKLTHELSRPLRSTITKVQFYLRKGGDNLSAELPKLTAADYCTRLYATIHKLAEIANTLY